MEDDNGADGLGRAGHSQPHGGNARLEAGSPPGEDGLLSEQQVSSLRGLLDFLSQEDDSPVAEAEPLLESSQLDASDSLPELGDLPEDGHQTDDLNLPGDPDVPEDLGVPEDLDVPGEPGVPEDLDQSDGPEVSGHLAAPDVPSGRLLTVPRPETGEARVDAALSLLDDLTELPVAEHPAVFERVHAQLSEVLGELGAGPSSGPPGRVGG